MDFALTDEDIAFRDELRAWLDAELPRFLADWSDAGAPSDGDGFDRTQARRQDWQRRLDDGRWAAINWPRDWHGREATPVQNAIYAEEMARVKAPGIYNANGIWQIGPMILQWGTPEQQARWLPGILSAEEHWCQGFSEPEAGSDLANMRTLAIARRRRLRGQRAEDVDLVRAPRAVGTLPAAHGSRPRSSGARSTRASPCSSSTCTLPGSSAGRSATSPATPC